MIEGILYDDPPYCVRMTEKKASNADQFPTPEQFAALDRLWLEKWLDL